MCYSRNPTQPIQIEVQSNQLGYTTFFCKTENAKILRLELNRVWRIERFDVILSMSAQCACVLFPQLTDETRMSLCSRCLRYPSDEPSMLEISRPGLHFKSRTGSHIPEGGALVWSGL